MARLISVACGGFAHAFTISKFGLVPSAGTVLNLWLRSAHKRNVRRHGRPIGFEALTETRTQELLLGANANLDPKDEDCRRGNHNRPPCHHETGRDEHAEHRSIYGVAQVGIGAATDQLVIAIKA